MARFPDVLVDLDLNDRFVDMTREGFDMAIRIGVLKDSTLRARRLGAVRMTVCQSRLLRTFRLPIEPDDLKHYQCIRYSQASSLNHWHYHDSEQRHGQVRVPIRALSSSGDFIREAAISGLGMILVPDFLVAAALAKCTLIPMLSEYEWYESAQNQNAYAVFPPTRHRSRRVRVFADFLAERLDE